MTLPVERARTRKPITWLTIIGVILLPVAIGGILVAALYNPVDRLDNMTAAVVNDDQPVTVNGQIVPLGRQLTAGLVAGSDTLPSNIHWVITNGGDASSGLANGTYDAVITIPQDFSAAATSTTTSTPVQATIQVTTPPDSRIVDDAIIAQVSQAAASLTGQQISETYLKNVFLGFTSLHDQLGQAASGATQLASAATQTATGAAQLVPAATGLASGASTLGSGAGQLAGVLGTLQTGTESSAAGATQLADGANAAITQIQQQGIVPSELTALAHGTAAGTADLAAGCAASGASPAYCAKVAAAAGATALTAAGVQQLADRAPTDLAQQLTPLATGAQGLADGLNQIASGIGAAQTAAFGLQSGAFQLADGATQLATGTQSLSDGAGQLASGASSLASGLNTAVAQVPTYTDQEAQSLATVVADPVAATGLSTNLFGASAIPLLATLALWFGGLASFVALRAIPRRSLASQRPSALLALRALLPGAIVGVAQGLLVAIVVEIAASYDLGTWSLFALLCALTGVAFAAVNQALVAVFGGSGRWISALVGVLAAATGIVSTVPAWLVSVAGFLPTAPASAAMAGVLTTAGGAGAAVVGLVVWAALAFVVTVLAVTRRRTTSAKALLLGPAPA
ncbi:YhgE/Pip family protein [Microbacterium sp. X-17]|uniref:YhgE/Pip family protein n=1 Tax=Microbacterium sp. X-17 TaxID=3144404 RepID=UPI0031F4FFEA